MLQGILLVSSLEACFAVDRPKCRTSLCRFTALEPRHFMHETWARFDLKGVTTLEILPFCGAFIKTSGKASERCSLKQSLGVCLHFSSKSEHSPCPLSGQLGESPSEIIAKNETYLKQVRGYRLLKHALLAVPLPEHLSLDLFEVFHLNLIVRLTSRCFRRLLLLNS